MNTLLFTPMQTIQQDRLMVKVKRKKSGVNYQLKVGYRLKRLLYRIMGKKLRHRRENKHLELDRICNASHIVTLLPSEAANMLLVKSKAKANQTLYAKDKRIHECLEAIIKH